ncbi:MAG: hypothetical protein ACKVP4_10525 [Hyphomicrobium sp.]
MATKPAAKKEDVKKEEKVEKRLPDFIIRCRQSASSEYWQNAGAAWEAKFKDGTTGYSIKLNNLPIGFTGDLLMMRPKEQE